jgi:hypothetical protein
MTRSATAAAAKCIATQARLSARTLRRGAAAAAAPKTSAAVATNRHFSYIITNTAVTVTTSYIQ